MKTTRENRLAVLLLQVGIATVLFVLAQHGAEPAAFPSPNDYASPREPEHPSPTPGPPTNRSPTKPKPEVTQTVVLERKYVLETSTDLINWTATGPPFIAESETVVTEFDVDVTGRCFRISEVP
jgi:hypothetical protein